MSNTGEMVVPVRGGRLYAERTGAGPELLMISGGGGDAGMYSDVVPLLASDYTVVAYDRRGNSRSRFTEADAAIDVATQADDAIAVLDHSGVDKAYAFGSSSGAIIALDIVARYPQRLLGAVVHEPPLVQLLPADSPQRRQIEDIGLLARKSTLRAYAAFGAMTLAKPPRIFQSASGQTLIAAATRVMLAASGLLQTITGRQPDSMTRQLRNADLLMCRELPSFCVDYQPDLTALAHAAVPWCLATGQDSVGKPYHTPALLLSQQLGVPCRQFPGGHTAYQRQPQEFTEVLVKSLAELAA
jgi:pimeloyl-ACP methyl ester carboxylesterase